MRMPTSAFKTNIAFDPAEVVGDLRPWEQIVGNPNYECSGFIGLCVGDNVYVHGLGRKHKHTLLGAKYHEGKRYIRLESGWYTWPKCYIHTR